MISKNRKYVLSVTYAISGKVCHIFQTDIQISYTRSTVSMYPVEQ